MRWFRVLVVAFALFGSARALALIPPLSEGELEDRASLVVVGTVLEVKKVGAPESTGCYYWQAWEGRVRVESVEKGVSEPVITVHWRSRGEDVNPEMPCVGGPDSYALSVGERLHLHLQGGPEVFSPFHRDGVRPAATAPCRGDIPTPVPVPEPQPAPVTTP